MSSRVQRPRRSSIEIGGQKLEIDAPGLKVIRRGPAPNFYWACDEAEEFKAYRPRTVRIHADLAATAPDEVHSIIQTIEDICQREQQAMLAWADGNVSDRERLAPKYDGSFHSLIELYRSDPDSGFQDLKANTKDNYEDFRGNRQYVSVGNLITDDRVSLFFMDYANKMRLKLFGRAKIVGLDDQALLSRLELPDYRARVERGFLIKIEGFDWNCPQHITKRFMLDEVSALTAPLTSRIAELEAELALHGSVRASDR